MVARKRNLVLLLIMFCVGLSAQIKNPIKFSQKLEQLSADEFELKIEAKLESGWHMYSMQHQDGGIGIPASFKVLPNPDVEALGKVQEIGNLHDAYNDFFEQQEKFYEKEVAYVQKVKANKATNASVELEFQLCDEESCLPPDFKTFEFSLTPKGVSEPTSEPTKTNENSAVETPINEPVTETSKKGVEEQSPKDSLVSTNEPQEPEVATNTEAENADSETELKSNNTQAPAKKKISFWELFLAGMGGGFLAILMPCLYPMIPLTVSLFTKQSKSRSAAIGKALIYGLSIIVIFVGLGFLLTLAMGPSALNAMATNPWVNLLFFAIFIVFAISFFGVFEITLPSSWINKADKQADKGGLIGIFFMALVLVLVSFSCTGPIIGSYLFAVSQTKEVMAPLIVMLGFSLALALPFTLFAIFPSWLNSLPNSGGWLNVLKVCLGFLELALAFKFLSNADLVWQAHWLEREVFLSIWIGIFFVMGLYLLNVFRTSHDSEVAGIGVPRLGFTLLTFAFLFYLLPGMWGAPLKLLSGLIPPKNYAEAPYGFQGGLSAVDLPEGAKFGPHRIPIFLDYEKGKAYAEKVQKPLMLDFTGDACPNCRKVEDNVWSDPRVADILTNDVVLVSLYVDRMVKLPEEQQVYSEEKGRKLRTVGDKWSEFQIKHFNINAQPYYVMVDENLKPYHPAIAAEYDIDVYIDWLENSIKAYEKNQ